MMLRVGQFNVPSRERYEIAMRGIFERRYYTNQGPLARAFEERLQATLNVKHAICVTNATIGMMMALDALAVKGSVIVPSVANVALIQALRWCGVTPVFASVNAVDGHVDIDALKASITDRGAVSAIVGANLWGGACDASALLALAREHDLPLMLDSSHAFGCVVGGCCIGTLGDIEILSFDAADIVNAAGAACVTTNDDELAARLRNIRSSYGAGRPVAVVKTSNGRVSEAQAAFGLLSLDDFEANRAHNRALFDAYCTHLGTMPGVRVVEPARVDISNHQTLVCAIDEETVGLPRDALIAELAHHQIEAVPIHAFDEKERIGTHIARTWLRLPLGGHVGANDTERVCASIGVAVGQRAASRSAV
jgi:dTDP-4-amino-4,6-dideoxygalactose transaminase